MKVKLLVSRSGADGANDAGDEIDVSDNEAVRMVRANPPQCEPLDKAAFKKAETAFDKQAGADLKADKAEEAKAAKAKAAAAEAEQAVKNARGGRGSEPETTAKS